VNPIYALSSVAGGAIRRAFTGAAVYSPTEDRGSVVGVKPLRVLVVEDEHLVALGIERALLDAGMQVAGIAATAEAAIDLALSEAPDVAVMDIRLAGPRDGVDAALELFRRFGVRCVFATAHHDLATQQRAAPAQPLAWVPKPYRPQTLVRAILDSLAARK
jgi:DNA-binding NarL/FixJ family response regulator